MLDGYIVTLPDGSQGSLMTFYEGIMDESITADDAGYILSDGTLLPTNGEAMWNPDADTLVALMMPYLGKEDGSVSAMSEDRHDDGDDDSIPAQPFNWKWVGVAALAYIAWKEFGQ